jgi:hypothetical protein
MPLLDVYDGLAAVLLAELSLCREAKGAGVRARCRELDEVDDE